MPEASPWSPGHQLTAFKIQEPSSPRDSFLFLPGTLWLWEGCYLQLKCHSLEHPHWTSLTPETPLPSFFLSQESSLGLCSHYFVFPRESFLSFLNWHSQFVYSFPKRAWFTSFGERSSLEAKSSPPGCHSLLWNHRPDFCYQMVSSESDVLHWTYGKDAARAVALLHYWRNCDPPIALQCTWKIQILLIDRALYRLLSLNPGLSQGQILPLPCLSQPHLAFVSCLKHADFIQQGLLSAVTPAW